MSVELREPGHQYFLEGRRLPSVTQILSGLGLIRDLWWLDPFYRQRGTATHACIAIHFRGQEVDWDFEGSEHIKPRFEKFLRLVDRHQIEPILFERPLASPAHNVAGTPDLLCRWDGALAIPDWKGSLIEPGYRLQVGGGYRLLLTEAAQRKEIDIDPAEILRAPAFLLPLGDEDPRPRQIKDSTPLEHLNLFKASAAVYNWRAAFVGES